MLFYYAQPTPSLLIVRLNQHERVSLTISGVICDSMCKCYKIAYVLGVHFKSGEWGEHRCGSVITTTFEGRSRYCVVNHFLRITDKDFASVTWLSTPVYPYWPITLVARVRELGVNRQHELPAVLPLASIEPTPILVERDGTDYYMMRVKGYDRVGT